MSNVEIKRDHKGSLHLFVAGAPVRSVNVISVGQADGQLVAYATIPLASITFGEVDNVVIPAANRFGGAVNPTLR